MAAQNHQVYPMIPHEVEYLICHSTVHQLVFGFHVNIPQPTSPISQVGFGLPSADVPLERVNQTTAVDFGSLQHLQERDIRTERPCYRDRVRQYTLSKK